MTAIFDAPATGLTEQEQDWVDQFMDETTLFLGPDPAIMRDHTITRRTQFEDDCIAKGVDPLRWTVSASGWRVPWTRATKCARPWGPRPAPNGAT